MINYLILSHKNLLMWLYGITGKSEFLDHGIYLIANRIDNYVVFFSIIVLSILIYQSIEGMRWKRLGFLITELFQIMIAVCIAWGISYVLKLVTHLPRPYLRYPDEIIQLFPYGGFDSFPSGHATLFMALACMIYLHHKNIGILFIFLAIIISITRVIAGVHFPIDILVGWVIGGGVSLAIYHGIKKPQYIDSFINKVKKPLRF